MGLDDAGAAVSILGLHDAGQALAEHRVRRFGAFAPARALFGMKGAGALVAATQTMAQYNPPAQPPPIGSSVQARPDVIANDPTRDPAYRPPATPQSPPPVVARGETAGDRGIPTPVLIGGGILILLVVLYFIAK